MRNGLRLCTEDFTAAEEEARRQDRDAERAAAARAAEAQRRQDAIDNTPIDLDATEAFDILFLDGQPTHQAINSARRVLRELDADSFVRVAVSRMQGRVESEPFKPHDWGGRGIAGLITKATMTRVWWIESRQLGITPTGRWAYTSGEGWTSRSGYRQAPPSIPELVDRRAERRARMSGPPTHA